MCSDASKASIHLSLHEKDCFNFLALPFELKILSWPAGGPLPIPSGFKLQTSIHGVQPRDALLGPDAGAGRPPGPAAAPSRLLPAHCRHPARCPAGSRLALCGQAAAGIPLPNYRHSVAAAGAGRLTGLPSESLTQPQRPSITCPEPARPHTRPSASALTSPPTRPPANQPL